MTQSPNTQHPTPNALHIGIAFRAPAAGEAVKACAGQIVAALLEPGGGRLVERAGSEFSVRYTPRQDASLFLLTASSTAPIQAADVAARLTTLENELLSAVSSLRTMPPSADEIAAAKRRVLGRAQFERETNAGLARAIGYADIVGGDTPEQFRQRVRRLTVTDVQEFIQRFLDIEQRVSISQ